MSLQLALSAGTTLMADQITKIMVVKHLSLGKSIVFGSSLRISRLPQPIDGRRLAHRKALLVLLWGLALTGIMLAIRSGNFFQQPWAQVALGVALGGASSNLLDRLRSGSIVDFIDLGWWPAFNLADVAITLGAIAALWSIR